jgi:hypothetical protein
MDGSPSLAMAFLSSSRNISSDDLVPGVSSRSSDGAGESPPVAPGAMRLHVDAGRRRAANWTDGRDARAVDLATRALTRAPVAAAAVHDAPTARIEH